MSLSDDTYKLGMSKFWDELQKREEFHQKAIDFIIQEADYQDLEAEGWSKGSEEAENCRMKAIYLRHVASMAKKALAAYKDPIRNRINYL